MKIQTKARMKSKPAKSGKMPNRELKVKPVRKSMPLKKTVPKRTGFGGKYA